MLRKIFYLIKHNIVLNNLAIILGLENILKSSNKMWTEFKVNKNKSLQENVGFSHRSDVEEALKKTHVDLINTVETYLKNDNSILDIGCGTGLYLKDFYDKSYQLYGIDISEQMIHEAKQQLPSVNFMVGNFTTFTLERKFDLIYSISVLEYIGRNEINHYFRKLANQLNPNGVIFIQYPHALTFKDTLYPDLNYIKYSPEVVEKYTSKYFNIVRHSHSFDNRSVKRFDNFQYPSTNGTFKNGYLLIASKKTIN